MLFLIFDRATTYKVVEVQQIDLTLLTLRVVNKWIILTFIVYSAWTVDITCLNFASCSSSATLYRPDMHDVVLVAHVHL